MIRARAPSAPFTAMTRALRSRSQYILAIVLALLLGAVALLDDLVEGRRLSLVDLQLAAALAVVALTGTVGIMRISETRRRLTERTREQASIVETARSIAGPDSAEAILDRVAAHAVRVLSIDRAAVFVEDRSDPSAVLAIAGHGVPEDLVGRRFGADEGLVGQVLRSGQPVLVPDYEDIPRPIRHLAAADIKAAGAVPIRWSGKVRGALSVGTTDPARQLGQGDLEVLAELADLGALALEQAEMRARVEQAMQAGVQALAAALDARDNYTGQHSEAVLGLARVVGRQLGLDPNSLAELELAARLHDVGKIAVPDAILRKPGRLDEAEWAVMKQHPVWGERLLAQVPGLENIARIVRAEHEHWDGSGYPDGLRGEEIPLASRIILACDAFHAMISDRPYRSAMPREAAVGELRNSAGCQFDPRVIDRLIPLVVASVERAPAVIGN